MNTRTACLIAGMICILAVQNATAQKQHSALTIERALHKQAIPNSMRGELTYANVLQPQPAHTKLDDHNELVSVRDRIWRPNNYEGIDASISSSFHLSDNTMLTTNGSSASWEGFMVRFNHNCMPSNSTNVGMWKFAEIADGQPMRVYRILDAWDEQTGYVGGHRIEYLGYIWGPSQRGWWGINVTSFFNMWQSGAWENHGLAFLPYPGFTGVNSFYASNIGAESVLPLLWYEETIDDNSPFSMCFPFRADAYTHTPSTMPMTAVFDHSINANGHNCPNDEIVAFTGEVGREEWGKLSPVTLSCGALYELRSEYGTSFTVNGNYVGADGGSSYLSYDGHTGHDYLAPQGVPVYASHDGIIIQGSDAWGEVIVLGFSNQHGTYQSHYLHMQNRVPVGTFVMRGDKIGEVSNVSPPSVSVGVHLHLTVKRHHNGSLYRVDPYGWTGSGTSPLDSQYPFSTNTNSFWDRQN